MENELAGCEYEELDHTAEVGLRIRAATPATLFACAAQALFALAGAQPSDRSAHRTVSVASIDVESLLVDWLSELIYVYETTGEVYDRCLVTTWTPTQIVATLEGGKPVQPPQRSIKAVTYYGLRLVEQTDGWLAEVYFDI